ncbi:unnamed protein product [Cuscuta campestris]|uniref:DUF4283 domain-containing protein n=1 Tax=Cuscuta campestris TaxID=132261 RepID=A0A484NBF5_9ASTE|nr:unnamed protein product [Cuscuta campestris]
MGKKTRSKEPTPPTPPKKKLPELKVDDEATLNTDESSDTMSSDDNQSVNEIIEDENVDVEDGNGTSSGSDTASVDEEAVEKELGKNKNTPKVFEKKPEPVQKKTFVELLKNNRKSTQGMQLFKVELNSTREVFIPDEAILPIEQLWGYCLVGCFSGKFPGLKAIQKMVDQWSIPCEILPHRKGWIVLKFWREEHRQTVLTMKAEELSIGNKKLLLKIPEKDFMWNCKSFATMPVWVKLLDVPMGFWSPLGLSHIASFLGTPLYSDGVTHTAASVYDTSMEPNPDGDYRRVNFCRVMIDMDLTVKPPVSVKVTYNGGEYIQKIEYEDMPCYCYHCEAFGHSPFDCKALHELHKRKFMEKQRLEEIATLEALKLAKQAETRSKDNKKTPHTSKTPLSKEAFKEPAPSAKDEVATHEDNGKKHLEEEVPVEIVNVDDPTPSFAVKDPNDGDTLMGTGSGILTSVPIKESLLKEPPDKEGKDKATAQIRSSGRTGGNQYHGNNRGGGATEAEGRALAPTVDEGLKFTSNKGKKWAKLDRILINHEWETIGWECCAEFCDMVVESDHCPVLLDLFQKVIKGNKPFKFFNMWLSHHSFDNILGNIWNNRVEGTRQYRLCKKLKLLKQPLRHLNNLEFGHISQRASEARKDYSHVMKQLLQTLNDDILLARSEMLRKKGGMTTSVEEISEQFIGYYNNLFGTTTQVIPIRGEVFQEGTRVSPEQGQWLTRRVSMAEVKEALFSIGNDKAPGRDGFTAAFFKSKWNIVGQSLCEAVEEFFRSGKLLKQINHATVSLIPKGAFVEGRNMMDNVLLAQQLVRRYARKRTAPKYDLMLFSRGDIESVTVLADALNHFSQAFGVRVNPQKSSIFLAGEIKDNRQDILNLVQFPLGSLPVRYLGLPLTSQRASEREFAPLIAKIQDNICKWNTKTLSQVGRVELIRSVIQGIYKFSKVAWSDICKPIQEGGLGLRNPYTWNQAFLIKNLWNIACAKDTLWVKWVHAVYLQNRKVWTWTPKKGDAHLFRKMSIARDLFVDKLGGPDGFHERLQSMKRLPTKLNLSHVEMESRECSLCHLDDEDTKHLFFECHVSAQIWNGVKEWLNLDVALSTLNRAIKWLRKYHHAHSNIKKMCRLATFSTVYHIWRLRNGAYFDQTAVDVHSAIQKIKLSVYKVMYRLFPNAPLRLGMEWLETLGSWCWVSVSVWVCATLFDLPIGWISSFLETP